MRTGQLYIDGEWTDAEEGRTFTVENPATGEALAEVADGSQGDAARAIDAAARTQEQWAATSPRERSEILRRAFEAVTGAADELAALMTAEMGKPLADSHAEVTYGAEFLRWFAEEAVRIGGDYTLSGNGATRVLVNRAPVGPCVLITPWNFPLAMATRKIGPAVAAGCTMVFKPAGLTPLTALRLTGLLADAGLPAGVLNVVTTSRSGDVVSTWMESGKARKVSFTGSTEVGRRLLAQAAPTVMRTSMELGGNAPFLVFDDADLEAAVEGAMTAKMRNMGEACTAANRFLVQRGAAEKFTRLLAERMGALTVGNGAEDGSQVGPLVEEAARRKVEELVADATDGGAEVVLGGRTPDGPGWFYPPTVLSGLSPRSRVFREEIFGPVAAVCTFDDEDEAVRLANDTEFGLVAYAYTNDLRRGLRLHERLQAGMIGLNTGLVSNPAAPFGGVKQSGLGREGGRLGIEEYLDVKFMAVPR